MAITANRFNQTSGEINEVAETRRPSFKLALCFLAIAGVIVSTQIKPSGVNIPNSITPQEVSNSNSLPQQELSLQYSKKDIQKLTSEELTILNRAIAKGKEAEKGNCSDVNIHVHKANPKEYYSILHVVCDPAESQMVIKLAIRYVCLEAINNAPRSLESYISTNCLRGLDFRMPVYGQLVKDIGDLRDGQLGIEVHVRERPRVVGSKPRVRRRTKFIEEQEKEDPKKSIKYT